MTRDQHGHGGHGWPDHITPLATDSTFRSFLRDDAALMLWSNDGERLVWATPAGAILAGALADSARRRLTALAGGLAPDTGARLERLRLKAGGRGDIITCACRRIGLAPEPPCLFLAATAALPASLRDAAPMAGDSTAPPAPAAPSPVDAGWAGDGLAELRALAQQRTTMRFLWETRADGIFARVSGELAALVGATAADLVGRRWDDIVGVFVSDPDHCVSRGLDSRDTWSGRGVLWRVAATRAVIPVEMAAVPVRDENGQFSGFRGFGLCRLAAMQPQGWPQDDGADPAGAPPAGAPPAGAPPAGAAPVGAAPDEAPPATPPEASLSEASPPEAAAEVLQPTVPDAAGQAPAATQSTEAPPETRDGTPPEAPAGQRPPPSHKPPPRSASVLLPFPGMRTAVPARLGGPRPPPLRIVGDAAADPSRPDAAAASPDGGGAAEAAPPRPPANAGPSPAAAASQPPGRQGLPQLSMSERNAFREIAKALGARFAGEEGPANAGPGDAGNGDAGNGDAGNGDAGNGDAAEAGPAPDPAAQQPEAASLAAPQVAPPTTPRAATPAASPVGTLEPAKPAAAPGLTALIDRLPLGVIVNRGETPVYANRAFLDLTGHASLDALAAKGLAGLFGRRPRANEAEGAEAPVTLVTAAGDNLAAEVRLAPVDWNGAPATLMTFRRAVQPETERRLRALELDLKAHEMREAELTAILDTATDGVIVLDERGRMLALNRSAEALFGYEQNEVAGELFSLLLASESHAPAFDYLEGLKANGVASVLNDGREVSGRERQGGKIPLFMTIGRVSEGAERKFCAVLRDMTAWKKAEGELLEAKRAAERASAHKSDFLAKMSHEIRTPLNAIIGFAEVMLEERLGPVGNERYKEYLNDIHSSGGHVISLVNDLLDLAKIEAGRLELSFTSVDLNEIVSGCVALMQPQANRERIVLRKSLAQKLPPVVADERSMRQIVLNILSNAVKFTDAGGQVIVSTTMTERGEVTLRVRDTGIGMSEPEIVAALEPFRQLATARRSGGTGLGLPLTKALVEANRGALAITSARQEGTLVEIIMPRTRVLAE